MDILNTVLIVAVVGFVVWLLVTYVPMPAPFAQVLIGLAVLGLVIWLLQILLGHTGVVPLRR